MRMSTAEKKILIVFCYYILLGVIALTAFTLSVKDNEIVAHEYETYFLCESKGIDPNNPDECDRSGFEQYQTTGLTVCGYILVGIFPAVNLIFVVNIKELKGFFSHLATTTTAWVTTYRTTLLLLSQC